MNPPNDSSLEVAANGNFSTYPRFGENCPDVNLLETGDLLFPRRPENPAESAMNWARYWLKQISGETNTEALNARFGKKISQILEKAGASDLMASWSAQDQMARNAHGYSPDPTRLPRKASAISTSAATENGVRQLLVHDSLLSSTWQRAMNFDPLTEAGGFGSFPGPDDPDFLTALLAILHSEFPGLLDDWLGMSVRDFILSPIGRFFMEALTSTDIRASFFVGHVGMVLRESAGASVAPDQGKVYVVECNITDYSHYRVAIHPYFSANDPAPGPNHAVARQSAETMYGWVNRRCALGESVWHARPNVDSALNKWQDQLLNLAKSYLGRPYGFFDNSKFGDDDRMYCSEYVYRVFSDVVPAFAPNLCDKQNWGDMIAYLYKSGQADQAHLLENIRDEPKYQKTNDSPFFVLPPALLWNSTGVHHQLNPGGVPYAPSWR